MVTAIETNFEDLAVSDLVRIAQDGDREAFGELVVRYERAVYLVGLRRLHDHAEAQELTQEVFLQALQRLHQLRDPQRFGGWLRSIANRMAINRVTRRKVLASFDPSALEATQGTSGTPLDDVLQRERATQLRAGLNRLGSMDRQTLEAFYVEGQSLAQMSDEFDSPLGTIKRRLHVARKRLARELAGPMQL